MDPKTPTTYRGLPPSLRTPSFGLPATHRYSPSGSSAHAIEDSLILEIGSRLLLAGFANEPTPRCKLAWSDSIWQRAGARVSTASVGRRQGGRGVWDLGFALRDISEEPHRDVYEERAEESAADIDARIQQQLGLVEDLVERGLRIAYNKYLLIDSKTRKILLPVPPLFPTKILTALIATVFTHFQPPSVTLLSAPVLATVAAGLRSALVVDIGWAETVVTPVYELRAIEGRGLGVHGRSPRSVRALHAAWTALLAPHGNFSPEDVEEIMERLGHASPNTDDTTPVKISTTLSLPFSVLAQPAEKTFLRADDENPPLPEVLYAALLRSAVDVRAACLERIVFVGGGARVPGLQKRVLQELEEAVAMRGWVLGRRMTTTTSAKEPTVNEVEGGGERGRVRARESKDEGQEDEEERGEDEEEEEEETRASDTSMASTEPRAPKTTITTPSIRGVKSLGVWCGGSLIAGLKIKGKVEVERERFLSQVSMGGTGLPAGW